MILVAFTLGAFIATVTVAALYGIRNRELVRQLEGEREHNATLTWWNGLEPVPEHNPQPITPPPPGPDPSVST